MCFYHKATDLVTRLYGAQGAMSSTIATWTKQGIAEFSGATSLNSAGESKKII